MDTSKMTNMNSGQLREFGRKYEELEIEVQQEKEKVLDADLQIEELNKLLETEKSNVLAEKRKLEGFEKSVSAAISIDGNDIVSVVVDGWWSRKQLLSVQNPLADAVRANHIMYANELRAKQAQEAADRAELERLEQEAAAMPEYDEIESEETNEVIDNLTQGDK